MTDAASGTARCGHDNQTFAGFSCTTRKLLMCQMGGPWLKVPMQSASANRDVSSPPHETHQAGKPHLRLLQSQVLA